MISMITNQREIWNKLFEKKDRYGTEPLDFAREAWDYMEKTKSKSVLDLGCGEGVEAIFFAEKGAQVTCIDFSDNAMASFKEKIQGTALEEKITLVKDDILNISRFGDESFDAIYSNLALHYFNDEETSKLFKEIHRVLRKNGLLIFRVKNTRDKYYGQGKKLEEDMYERKGHVRHFFSKEYLNSKIKDFETISIKADNKTMGDGTEAWAWKVVLRKAG